MSIISLLSLALIVGILYSQTTSYPATPGSIESFNDNENISYAVLLVEIFTLPAEFWTFDIGFYSVILFGSFLLILFDLHMILKIIMI